MVICEDSTQDESNHSNNLPRERRGVPYRVAITLIDREIYAQETAQGDESSKEEHDEHTTPWPAE
jgi:hypothetical protein